MLQQSWIVILLVLLWDRINFHTKHDFGKNGCFYHVILEASSTGRWDILLILSIPISVAYDTMTDLFCWCNVTSHRGLQQSLLYLPCFLLQIFNLQQHPKSNSSWDLGQPHLQQNSRLTAKICSTVDAVGDYSQLSTYIMALFHLPVFGKQHTTTNIILSRWPLHTEGVAFRDAFGVSFWLADATMDDH